MKSRFLWFLFCVFVFFQACQGQIKNKDQIKDLNAIEGIRKSREDTDFVKHKQEVESKLGLSSIEDGFDGLQIRIWKGFANPDSLKLIIFSKSDDGWSARFYTLVLHYNNSFDSIKDVTRNIKIKEPRSGWNIFIDSLLKLKILELPDYSEVPSYTLSMDSEAIRVEVAADKKYRFYSYLDIESQNEVISEATNMRKILELIEEEFGGG